jgi:predicted transcriptional regulator
MIEETLHELGLGRNDVKVYLTLLKGGKSTIATIATKSGVHRVNVYDALKNLRERGLVSSIEQEKKKIFVANDPQNIELILKSRDEKVRATIPQLKAFYEMTENKAQIFEGWEGVKRTINDMIMTGKDIEAFGIPKLLPDTLGAFLVTFHRDRIAKKIRIRHIYNEDAHERIKWLNSIKYSEAKYLPPEYSVPATTLVYGNKTAFWIWSKEPFCVIIESEKMADAYRKYFEILYKIAK